MVSWPRPVLGLEVILLIVMFHCGLVQFTVCEFVMDNLEKHEKIFAHSILQTEVVVVIMTDFYRVFNEEEKFDYLLHITIKYGFQLATHVLQFMLCVNNQKITFLRNK